MKAQLDWQAYRNLEVKTQPKTAKRLRSAEVSLYDIWQIVLAYVKLSSEPRVWQTKDEAGQPFWSAYDPKTEKFIHRVSADRVRDWLHL